MIPMWTNWKLRHQHPLSMALHAVGIPLAIAAVVVGVWQLLEWRWDLWWRPAGLLMIGYLLQWLGHRIEGNTMGEWIVVCKLLGRPYVAVAPQYHNRDFESGTSISDDTTRPT